ncbi:MAG: NfeD family protein [Terrimicrobiaceae bacterium]
MIAQAIIVLVVVGFLMIAAEVFVPGLILGSLGSLCLLGSVALCYMAFGPLVGTAAFAALAVLTILGFFLWLWLFPHTPIGKKMTLNTPLSSQNSLQIPDLLGVSGEAVTPLRPAGTAIIQGRRMDVVAESGLIESGEKITVISQEGMRIVVRKQA